jgi:predicted Fe-Mo cluster-binding NifX family protein
MIIAIAANDNFLKSIVDPHFGRCNWYCLYDTDTLKSSFVENTARYQNQQAGSDAAKFLIDKGIKIVIAGRFGSKVIDIFRANNVQMIIPQTEQTISKIINSYK